jgi:hypothetical protein
MLICGRYAVVSTFELLDRDADPFARQPIDRTVGEASEPDLRALQVRQDSDIAAGGFSREANLVESAPMLRMIAVAEVQAGDIHARLDERPGSLWCIGRRP